MYLRKRSNGVLYFRRRIPSDLKGMVDPGLFHYSLGTRKRQDAIKFYAAALDRSEQEITIAREKIRTAEDKGRAKIYPHLRERRKIEAEKAKRKRARAFCQYDEGAIESLVYRWFEKEMRETEAIYRDAFLLNSREERLELENELSEEEAYLLEERPGMQDMILFRKVRSILDAEDCDAPREWLNDPLFRRFYGLVTEGLLHLNRIAVSLVQNGKMPERFQKLPAFAPAASHPVFVSGHPSSGGPSNTLDELISRFEKEPKRQCLREATRKEYTLTYRALREEIGGDKPISHITRDEIRAVADTFRHLPSRATLNNKSERLKDLAARAKAEQKPLADVKTFNKKVHHISAIFRYAVIEQMITNSPAQNLAVPVPPSSGDEKGFSPKQLNIIFSGKLFRQFTEGGKAFQFEPNHKLRPCFFWSPLIAVFHGMRSGEILQLKTANVFERDGITVLKLEGQVKNRFAYRVIPLHPELIRLGFIQYIERVKKAGHEMAFPDAKFACDKKQSTWFQKPFSNYLKKIGVKTDRGQCFHSFRHTWNGGMRRVDVPQEIRRALGGWKDESSEASYGPDYIPRLFRYVEKLEYPGLDLSRLAPKFSRRNLK